MFDYRGSFIIEYTLMAITGLRIGGSKEQFEIGGLDNPVIKVEMEIPDYDGKGHVLPKYAPYIPGSSLKGKIRSLLEWANGNVKKMIEKVNADKKGEADNKPAKKLEEAGKPCDCGQCNICIVFGAGDSKIIESLAEKGIDKIPGPPRARFFDAYPTWETIEKLREAYGENIFTEIKTENQINRLTSKAQHPRKVERVPAGAEFEGVIVFDIYKKEDTELLEIILRGMKILEDSYLGGCGSRGSGRVKIIKTKVKWRSKEFYLGKEAEKTIAEGDLDKIIEEIKKFSLNFA